MHFNLAAAVVAAGLLITGCGADTAAPNPEAPPAPEPPAEPALKADVGVDVDGKVIHIGTLNDESGPGAAIGKPFAAGKRLLAAAVNAGDLDLLPEGWTVELVERDHGYNPQASVQAYNEIAPEVLFVGTSFGTPNTLPLRPMLERDGVIAYPASLSSEMAAHAHTPPLGPSYVVEAKRAMDWVVESAGGAEGVKAGIVYQQDDYGKDGHAGWKEAAAAHGVEVVAEQTVAPVTIVSEQAIAPTQKDFAPVVAGLKDKGATHVLLTTLPSATGPVLGTAAQLQYMPVWVGNTPAWIDRFFDPEVIPAAVFGNYHQVLGLPFWGEDRPGMDTFTGAWDAHGGEMGSADMYILMSWVQGLAQPEAARRAIEGGDITRAGYKAAVGSIEGWDAGGLIQPIDLSSTPYVTGTRTRVLKPDMEAGSWTTVSDWAEPAH